MTEFQKTIYEIVRGIPKGQTMTYKHVAIAAGRPRAFRTVGNLLNRNNDPTIPCHRVVRSDGTLGGYNRGEKEKRARLKAEGAIK